MVSVVVKGGCLLLEMFPAQHDGAGLARPHLLVLRTRLPGSHHLEQVQFLRRVLPLAGSLPSALLQPFSQMTTLHVSGM